MKRKKRLYKAGENKLPMKINVVAEKSIKKLSFTYRSRYKLARTNYFQNL